jgi:hypothetical protein
VYLEFVLLFANPELKSNKKIWKLFFFQVPWRCLCLGSLEQVMNIFFPRFTTRQPASQKQEQNNHNCQTQRVMNERLDFFGQKPQISTRENNITNHRTLA